MNADQIVWVDPERMSGVPCFTGTRVPISTLEAYLNKGDRLEEFLDDFPSVSREQALALTALGKAQVLATLEPICAAPEQLEVSEEEKTEMEARWKRFEGEPLRSLTDEQFDALIKAKRG